MNRMAGADCGEVVNEERRFFKFSRNDLDLFDFNAQNKSLGVNIINLQCGTFAVQVNEGQRVREGQTLLVMEAMKMEHRIQAPRAGGWRI